MNPEQLQQLLGWLNDQIRHVNHSISEAKESHNYGREAESVGMKQAYEKCLGKLSSVRA